jgi:ABC-type nitrate/sulfonate/bicarbonate transport system permease component
VRARRPRRRLGIHGPSRVVAPLLFALAVLAAWQLYAELSGIREATLPKPTDVASAIWHQRGLLADNGWVTLREVLLGYLLAVAVGLALGIAVAGSRAVARMVYPWLVVSQMVPIVAIAPIVVIWTGFDIRPKLIVIALVSFFPVAVNTIDGLRSTEPELLNLLRTLGAGRRRRFLIARWPSALPSVFSGLRIAAALAVIGAVFAEWVGSSSGLGYLILTLNNQTATAEMFAAVAVLALIGIALFALVVTLERLALPWYWEERRGGVG